MRILKRVKENNIVVGYMIDIGNNEVKFIEKESAVNLQSLITNAVLLKDSSDYRGRDGVIIETIQNETRHSTIVHKKHKTAGRLHDYINVSKLFDFSSKKTVDSIYHDLGNVYKITNVMQYDDEDALYVICEALYRDYVNELANYESYVEFGMDARIMMELRKSAVFPVGEKYLDFSGSIIHVRQLMILKVCELTS